MLNAVSIAAIGSQFSAAVADNEGAGGLIADITHRKVTMRNAYLLILLVPVGLTWESDVNGIIAYASRQSRSDCTTTSREPRPQERRPWQLMPRGLSHFGHWC